MIQLPESENVPSPEQQKEVLDDNARKFVLDSLAPTFIEEGNEVVFLMTTDWLETGQDTEKKLAYKKFRNGDVQILLIAKVTKDGHRTSEKTKINEAQYNDLLKQSICRVQKIRHEFQHTQNGVVFDVKYDEFIDSPLRVLEVDAGSEKEREAFNPTDFQAGVSEVTGQSEYYGYRVASIIK